MDDLISCPICHEHFKRPKVLYCGHSFCENCIDNHMCTDRFHSKTVFDPRGGSYLQRSYKCPVCQTVSKIKQTAKSLPSNYSITHVIQHFTEEEQKRTIKEALDYKKKAQEQTACCICSYAERHSLATDFCFHCEKKMCKECLQKHNDCFKDHVSFEVTGHGQPFQIVQCKDHPSEILRYYCIECDAPLCETCVILNHSQHKFKPLEDVLRRFNESAENSLTVLNQKLAKNDEIWEGLDDKYHKLVAVRNQIISEIDKRKCDLVNQLEEQKSKMVDEVSAFFKAELDKFVFPQNSVKLRHWVLKNHQLSAHGRTGFMKLLKLMTSGSNICGELRCVVQCAEEKEYPVDVPPDTHVPLFDGNDVVNLGKIIHFGENKMKREFVSDSSETEDEPGTVVKKPKRPKLDNDQSTVDAEHR